MTENQYEDDFSADPEGSNATPALPWWMKLPHLLRRPWLFFFALFMGFMMFNRYNRFFSSIWLGLLIGIIAVAFFVYIYESMVIKQFYFLDLVTATYGGSAPILFKDLIKHEKDFGVLGVTKNHLLFTSQRPGNSPVVIGMKEIAHVEYLPSKIQLRDTDGVFHEFGQVCVGSIRAMKPLLDQVRNENQSRD